MSVHAQTCPAFLAQAESGGVVVRESVAISSLPAEDNAAPAGGDEGVARQLLCSDQLRLPALEAENAQLRAALYLAEQAEPPRCRRKTRDISVPTQQLKRPLAQECALRAQALQDFARCLAAPRNQQPNVPVGGHAAHEHIRTAARLQGTQAPVRARLRVIAQQPGAEFRSLRTVFFYYLEAARRQEHALAPGRGPDGSQALRQLQLAKGVGHALRGVIPGPHVARLRRSASRGCEQQRQAQRQGAVSFRHIPSLPPLFLQATPGLYPLCII